MTPRPYRAGNGSPTMPGRMTAMPTGPTTDEVAVVQAALDYFEGWFEGDAARMERALHPGLVKRGYDGSGDELDADTAQSMIDATERGVGTRYGPDRRHFEVEVVDMYRTIANVTVHSDV